MNPAKELNLDASRLGKLSAKKRRAKMTAKQWSAHFRGLRARQLDKKVENKPQSVVKRRG